MFGVLYISYAAEEGRRGKQYFYHQRMHTYLHMKRILYYIILWRWTTQIPTTCSDSELQLLLPVCCSFPCLIYSAISYRINFGFRRCNTIWIPGAIKHNEKSFSSSISSVSLVTLLNMVVCYLYCMLVYMQSRSDSYLTFLFNLVSEF